jgi:hypothetical protein
MSRKLLGHNGFDRAAYWHEHGDGSWAIEQVQSGLEELMDRNKVYQNHGNGMKWGDDLGDLQLDVRHVATIPWIVIEQWKRDYGIDYMDPDPEVQKRIDRLLDSNEFKWLRTTNSRLE